MAESNGKDQMEGASVLPSHTAFKIGGKNVSVPPLTLSVLEMRDKELSSLAQGMATNAYANVVLLIAATSIEAAKSGEDSDPEEDAIQKTFRRLKRGIIFGEMRLLVEEMDSLLLNSGYASPGEAQAATVGPSPGTEMSTESPPISQSVESAAETPSESKESLH